MHHAFSDRYSRLASPVHRLPAALKMAAAFSLMVVVILARAGDERTLAVAAAFLIATAAVSRVPAGFIAKRLLFLEPVVVGVAILRLFASGGLQVFLLILAKSTICLLTMILLSNTTPFAGILGVLKRLRVPALLVTVLALTYRYLFVLIDEAEKMKRARRCRTLGATRRRSWRSPATLISRLFIRSSERAERIYAAMCARGWR
jgi:cobalt/nickel transport system permease protein